MEFLGLGAILYLILIEVESWRLTFSMGYVVRNSQSLIDAPCMGNTESITQ